MMDGLLQAPQSVPRAPSRRVFLLAVIVGPLALASLALHIGGQVRDAALLRSLVSESYDERVNAAELSASFSQAESAERGFLMTGDPAFLDTYETARARVAADMAKAASFGTDAGGQAARVARLRKPIDRWMEESARTIAVRQREGGPAAAEIGKNQSAASADTALATATRLTDAEAAAIRARIEVLHGRNVMFQHLIWRMMLLFALILLAGLWLLWRAQGRRFAVERDAHDASTRFLAMFANNTDATLVLDKEGRIEAANAATTRLLGYATGDLIGREVMTLFDSVDHRPFYARIGLVDGVLTRPYWLDRTIRHCAGNNVAVDIALGLLDLPDGLRVIATMRDIAQRKTVERLKDEFLATISHELRTPLTSVIGALGLLRNRSAGVLPDAADRLVEIAENNALRLVRLVNDLLDIEKIGAGRMRFERTPLNLPHVAQSAIDGAHGIAGVRGVTLELSASDPALVVEGDRERLIQVFANLLSNAVRFSPRDGVVRIALARRGGQAIVSVDDEGPGVAADFNGRIFERFAQAPDTPAGGSGLGLAISREIVAAHDGRIWFGRSPQGGARFAFALALSQQVPLRGSQPCILLAEADPGAARHLRDMLEAEDCRVECVASDRATLAAAVASRHDALLIDIDLPAMGGVETVRALRRRTETRTLPVILLSADAKIDAGLDSGPALAPIEWIDKTIEQGRLIAAVRRAIADTVRARPTLLHIDDDVDMLEVAAVVLAEHARIVHATSLASARAMLGLQAPDLVILDLGLPDGSGAELIPELLRADGSPIPTIIYTAADVLPEVGRQVDAVLVKSRRSLDSLGRMTQRILAGRSDSSAMSA